MRSPWLQILLLFIYFLLVLIVTHVLDVILWYQHGLSPTQVVNPIMLKVRQIKLLLDSRGVSYSEYFEKSELVERLQDSAEVVVGEVEQVSETAVPLKDRLKPVPAISYFTGGGHFYEQVEDTRDSVWLVQVVTNNEPLLDDYNWRLVCSQLEPFGVRIGIFDCQRDSSLCKTKGWSKPLLLLAMPKGSKPKDKVVLQEFYSDKPHIILGWVHQQLSLWVRGIGSIEEIETEWLEITNNQTVVTEASKEKKLSKSDTVGRPSVKVLLLSHLLQPPLFLAALSIKFTGRVRFGMFTVKKEDADVVRKRLRLQDRRLPLYLVVTPEKKVVYGSRKLEYFNMWSMNVFLRGIQPETNDVFLCSLIIVNMFAAITISLISTQLWWKWTVYCLWTLIKYNIWLFSSWLVSLAMAHFPVFGSIVDHMLFIIRVFGLSQCGSFVRTELALLVHHPFLFFLSFVSFTVSVSCLIRLFSPSWISSTSDLELDPGPWWEVLPMDSYWVNYLFRPVASLSRPMVLTHVELEDGLEMLIERLAVPNLWLQPVIPFDYMKDLPIWRYRGWNHVQEPLSSYTHGDKPVLRTESPEFLEHLMDTEDPQILVSGCSVCSRKESQSLLSNRPRSSSNTSSDILSSSPKDNAGPLVPQCTNSLLSDWNCGPLHNCHSLCRTANLCEKCRRYCDNLPNTRVQDTTCVTSVQRNTFSQKDIHRLCCSAAHEKIDESYLGDCDNIAWIFPDFMLPMTDCAVCLESYNYGSLLCGLPCGHNYHQRCIMAWLQRDNHHCPVCRWPAYRLKNSSHFHQE